jgi:AbrB family looped-hinge helix DNA binding protein
MVRARLTTKGQLTIPVELRRRYGLDAGDEVEFIAEDRGAYLIPIKRKALLELAGALPATKSWPGMKKARQVAGRRRGAEMRARATRG